jgi:hypothetical protein
LICFGICSSRVSPVHYCLDRAEDHDEGREGKYSNVNHLRFRRVRAGFEVERSGKAEGDRRAED